METKADVISERMLEFAAAIIRLVSGIPQSRVNRHICLQLFRSASSIGANYEEARGAESRQNFGHKLQVSLKEARESHYWLRLILKANISTSEKTHQLLSENQQLCDILAKSIKSLKANGQA
jgi:four helix bundle protein